MMHFHIMEYVKNILIVRLKFRKKQIYNLAYIEMVINLVQQLVRIYTDLAKSWVTFLVWCETGKAIENSSRLRFLKGLEKL